MRPPNKGLIAGLSIALSLAAALMGMATDADAQFHAGPSISVGPRMSPSFNPPFRSNEPRFHRVNNNSGDKAIEEIGKGRGKGKATGVVVPRGGEDRPSRHPPGKPGRGGP